MKYIETTYLWHTEWYDGPLEGACEYNGKVHWFLISDRVEYIENGNTFKRDKFNIYPISDEDIEHQKYWHELEEKIDSVCPPHNIIARKYFNHLCRLSCKDPQIDKNNPIGFTHF